MNTITLSLVSGTWTHLGAVEPGVPGVTWDVPWPLVLGLVVSTVLPLLVGLVTKVVTNPRVRAILLAALSAVTGLLTELGNAWSQGVEYDIGRGLLLAFGAFILAVGMHFGLWAPTGASMAAKRALGGDAPPARMDG